MLGELALELLPARQGKLFNISTKVEGTEASRERIRFESKYRKRSNDRGG